MSLLGHFDGGVAHFRLQIEPLKPPSSTSQARWLEEKEGCESDIQSAAYGGRFNPNGFDLEVSAHVGQPTIINVNYYN